MRFSIRDLLWLTLIVAVAVAWRLDQQSLTQRIDALQRSQVNLGGVIPRIIVQAEEESELGIPVDAAR